MGGLIYYTVRYGYGYDKLCTKNNEKKNRMPRLAVMSPESKKPDTPILISSNSRRSFIVKPESKAPTQVQLSP